MKKTFAIRNLRGFVAAALVLCGLMFASTQASAQQLQTGAPRYLNTPAGNLVNQDEAKNRLEAQVTHLNNDVIPTAQGQDLQDATLKATYYKGIINWINVGTSVRDALYYSSKETGLVLSPGSYTDPSAQSRLQILLNETFFLLQ